MAVEAIIKASARRWVDRYTRSGAQSRPVLGNGTNLLAHQERVIGPLVLSQSMGPVMFEVGRKVGYQTAVQLVPVVIELKKQQKYRSLIKSETLEEAKLSTQVAITQQFYQMSAGGLLELTEYEKDKLIVFQIHECATCFGLENIGKAVCYYIMGNMCGVVEAIFRREVGATESKCTAKGDPCCEFRYDLSGKGE